MKITYLKDLSKEDFEKVLKRSSGNSQKVIPVVKKILEDVKKNGDQAVLKYERKFSSSKIKDLRVTEQEIKEAYLKVNKEVISSLKQAAKNIRSFVTAQLKNLKEARVETEEGVNVWREWRAVEKVGLYIPGGKASYPSTVLMTGILAKIAGCKQIIITTPVNVEGQIPEITLIAADLIGIKNIYKVGGAQAIAAMAYGTQSIPQVYKIFGPGNQFVNAAKTLVFPRVAIDMPAGPSEVFIIADESANPKFIAADLMADGEHAEDSACVLITNSKKIAEQTLKEINNLVDQFETGDRIKKSFEKYGLIALVKNLEEAIDFANEYAPEHLEIQTENPFEILAKITNAGSVFLGDYTAKASGDYATGANHVLPTGGMAKMFSALSIENFGKLMEVQEVTKSGLTKIRNSIEILAEVEGLPAHKYSSKVRFE